MRQPTSAEVKRKGLDDARRERYRQLCPQPAQHTRRRHQHDLVASTLIYGVQQRVHDLPPEVVPVHIGRIGVRLEGRAAAPRPLRAAPRAVTPQLVPPSTTGRVFDDLHAFKLSIPTFTIEARQRGVCDHGPCHVCLQGNGRESKTHASPAAAFGTALAPTRLPLPPNPLHLRAEL